MCVCLTRALRWQCLSRSKLGHCNKNLPWFFLCAVPNTEEPDQIIKNKRMSPFGFLEDNQ